MSKKGRIIPGGLSEGMSPDDFDQETLEEGTKVELEHTSSRGIATEIAMDHLVEDSNYYKKLAEMEAKKGRKLSRRMKFQGMDISIETDKGELRYWYDPHNKTEGSTKMQYPYGYIRRTMGDDDEYVDCVEPSTDITMFDLTIKSAGDIEVGDELLSFDEDTPGVVGSCRKMRKGVVQRVKTGKSEMIRFTFSDGTSLATTPGHLNLRFKGKDARWRKSHDISVGQFLCSVYSPEHFGVTDLFKEGYLYGAYLGDGSVRLDHPSSTYADIRVELKDRAIVDRVFEYWKHFGLSVAPPREFFPNQTTAEVEPGRVVKSSSKMFGLFIRRADAKSGCERFLTQTKLDSVDWCRGFLSGLIDTDGGVGRKSSVDIFQTKDQKNTFDKVSHAWKVLGFDTSESVDHISVLTHNKRELKALQTLHKLNLALDRKKDLSGLAIRLDRREVVDISYELGEYVAIQTDTGTYIANGLATHNCYVGPSENEAKVYIIRQNKAPNFDEYDEEKVMIGFESEKDAKQAYLTHYNSPKFFESIRPMGIEDFKEEYVKKAMVGPPVGQEGPPGGPQDAAMNIPMFDPYDMNIEQSVKSHLASIGSVSDKDLYKLSQEIWGDGYEYRPISPNHIRAELRGYLQDQLEWLKMNPMSHMLSPQDSLQTSTEMPHESDSSQNYGPGGNSSGALLNEQNLDGKLDQTELSNSSNPKGF